jgi:DNA-binding beta-propeller fold protein YncE
MLFLALLAGSCAKPGAPSLQGRQRIGLGATALALAADGRTLAVACRRSNDVWILDMQSGAGLARIDTGAKPRALFFQGENPAFFVAEGVSPKASVALLKLSDQRVARRYHPQGLLSRWLVLPDQDRLLAARLGEPLLGVYRLKDWHLVKAVTVGGEVTALAADKDAWWAATRQADSLARLSPRNLALQAVALAGPEPRGLALDSDAGQAYVACQGRQGEAVPMALPSPTPTKEVLSPLSPEAEVDDTGDSLAAAEEPVDVDDEEVPSSAGSAVTGKKESRYEGGGVAVFRLKDTRRVDYIDVPGGPTQVQLSPDGQRLALGCADGQLRMLDLASRKVVHMLRLGGMPGAMQLSPDGKELWIALSDAKQLLRVKPGQGW